MPSRYVELPFAMMTFTMMTERNTVAVSNGWKLRSSGMSKSQAATTMKGMTKTATCTEEPTATPIVISILSL